MFDLTGKVAVVTGGSRGLGRADCLALARAGADVVVTDILLESDPQLATAAERSGSALTQLFAARKEVHTEKTAEQIRAIGRRSVAMQLDVTDREQVAAVFARIADEFGGIDILVNSAAAVDHVAQLENQSDQLWDRDIGVNLSGAYNCTKAAFASMRDRGSGRVVFMSSVTGTLGGFGQASYASSNAAVTGLTRTVALEGARYGITANAVAAGYIATEAAQAGNPRLNERLVLRTAMRAPGEPDDVAHTVVFLCSDEAKYITGQVIAVAGGIDLFTF